MTEANYSPGLEGVIAGITHLSYIDTEHNILTYRGYNVQDLCDHATFEEVAYLLLYGELPNRHEYESFCARLVTEREVPSVIYDVLRLLPPNSEPMDWIKVAVGTLALYDPAHRDNSRDANLAKALRLTAKMPALVANGWRVMHGLEPVPSMATDTHAAHFLRLLTGKPPDQFAVKTLNVTLILYAEHGFNASTFTARVVVSTLSDLYSGVIAAMAALKGPLHGGANEEVMKMLLEIGEPENAEPWLRKKLTKTPENPKPRIMGFGHREYKRGDQRAQIVKSYTRELARRTGQTKWVEIADILERTMREEKGLYPNLDFPVSPAYYLMGLPIPLYTPIFVISRVVGWSAHIIEQLDDNRLIRPTSLYKGTPARPFVPMAERG